MVWKIFKKRQTVHILQQFKYSFVPISCTHLFIPIHDLWFFWYWISNIGRVFHIGTFYQTNLVVENIFAEPREYSCWERSYMIVSPVLTLCRNQPINMEWKSMHWFLCNGDIRLKFMEEMKDSWNLSYSKMLYWLA